LICDGTGVISLIPLHGLSEEWKPIIHDVGELDLTFPGYVTLKNGPKFEDNILDGISGRICVSIHITESFNNHFEGNSRNLNLGELSRWRTWEDDSHVAFLTRYGSTPGCTVLVPWKQLTAYSSLHPLALYLNTLAKPPAPISSGSSH
jgi:beta-aspartyl-peptidase (threonine type)